MDDSVEITVPRDVLATARDRRGDDESVGDVLARAVGLLDRIESRSETSDRATTADSRVGDADSRPTTAGTPDAEQLACSDCGRAGRVVTVADDEVLCLSCSDMELSGMWSETVDRESMSTE